MSGLLVARHFERGTRREIGLHPCCLACRAYVKEIRTEYALCQDLW